MRVATNCLVAVSLIGAAALSLPTAAAAQGVYFNGPGFGIGVGSPYYGGYAYSSYPYGGAYGYGGYGYSYGSYSYPYGGIYGYGGYPYEVRIPMVAIHMVHMAAIRTGLMASAGCTGIMERHVLRIHGVTVSDGPALELNLKAPTGAFLSEPLRLIPKRPIDRKTSPARRSDLPARLFATLAPIRSA